MRRLIVSLVLIAGGLGTTRADEGGVTVVGGVDFGFRDLTLRVGADSGGGGGSFDASYVTINPTIALAVSSFYLSLSYEKTIDAEKAVGQEGGGGTPKATVLDFSRTDSTVTFGYRFVPSFSVFAGYTRGENNFTETSTDAGALRVSEIDYSEKGPFVGAAYNKVFGDKGTLGLSLGYARLDGELRIRRTGGTPRPDQVGIGDNTGLSYGLSWSGSLTGSLGYRIGIKQTKYEMDRGPNNPQDIKEKYTTFFLGIQNYF